MSYWEVIESRDTRILQQSDDFGPHDPIEEILTYWPVIAHWSLRRRQASDPKHR